MVTYREHPVPTALRWAVACGRTLENGPEPQAGWRVLPDTHMDIVAADGLPVMLAGPATTVQLVDLPAAGVVAHRAPPRPGADDRGARRARGLRRSGPPHPRLGGADRRDWATLLAGRVVDVA